jgi:hypothetical protein
LALVDARSGSPLSVRRYAIHFFALVSRSGTVDAAWALLGRCSGGDHSFASISLRSSRSQPSASIFAMKVGGEVVQQVRTGLGGLVVIRGELRIEPSSRRSLTHPSPRSHCTMCHFRANRRMPSEQAIRRWWGERGSNPRPRDYESLKVRLDLSQFIRLERPPC